MKSSLARVQRNAIGAFLVVLLVAACGKSNTPTSPTTPTTPNTPAPAANRAPQITASTVTPANGVSTLTTHSFSASATDPDGDSLTYTWDFGNGSSAAAAGATVTYTNANTTTYQAVLTVTDGKGGTTTATVPVVSASMTGVFTGTLIGAPVTVTLTQAAGGIVTGSWEQPTIGAVGEVGPTGEPGRIQANGQFELRFKVRVGAFIDFYFRGTMNAAGDVLTGNLFSSGFTGESMVLTKAS